jgi:hypothetical protein
MGSLDTARILALEECMDSLEKQLLKITQHQQNDMLHQMQKKFQQLEVQIQLLQPDVADSDLAGYLEDFAVAWAAEDPDYFREKFEQRNVVVASAQGDAETSSGQVRDAEVVHHVCPRWNSK